MLTSTMSTPGKEYKKPGKLRRRKCNTSCTSGKSGRQYNAYDFWRESEETYQDAIQSYNQLIHGVDYALGMIRKSLEENGVADNTIIIFTSDNGYSCGAHNLGGKSTSIRGSFKVTLNNI